MGSPSEKIQDEVAIDIGWAPCSSQPLFRWAAQRGNLAFVSSDDDSARGS